MLTQDVPLRVAKGYTETITVTPLGENQYRLEDTLISSLMAESPMVRGDIVEAVPDCDGALRVTHVVTRSGWSVTDFIVSREVIESAEFTAYVAAIEEAGGYFDCVYGGVILVYLPQNSPFDPCVELDKVIDRVYPRP